MNGFTLITSIVPHPDGEQICQTANKAGAAGGTILMGTGTATSFLAAALGLGDTQKDIVYQIVPSQIKSQIIDSIRESCLNRKHYGILFTTTVSSFTKTASTLKGDIPMEKASTHKIITVILNKGFAYDAMAAARKAGAAGGTILGGKGTAKEDDAKFFGVPIVPEKDILLILAENEKTDSIIDQIKSLSYLSEKGSGIIYTSDAADFTLLGK